MTTERDIHNQILYAERNGMEKGMEEKAIDIARKLKAQGIGTLIISQATGLTEEQVLAL